MKVRTIRDHSNEHGKIFEKLKSSGHVYEVDDEEAARLIDLGYVEKADGGNARAKGPDQGARGTAKDDG